MRVLVACEYSGVVRRAFRALGHDAYSCDLLPAEDASPYHFLGDVRQFLRPMSQIGEVAPFDVWDLMIAHPPCTYLCRAGWHWVNKPDCATHPLKGEPRRKAAAEAAEFFRELLAAPIPRICIENPRPIVHAGLPKPTQTIHPFEYGHPEFKATCLWLKGLPILHPTRLLEPPKKGTAEHKAWSKVHRASPGPDRWKDRSRTYEGIGRAFAEQWGTLDDQYLMLHGRSGSTLVTGEHLAGCERPRDGDCPRCGAPQTVACEGFQMGAA